MEVDEAIEYLNSLLALAKKFLSGELRIQDEEIEAIETLIKGYKEQQKRLLKKDKKISDRIKEIEKHGYYVIYDSIYNYEEVFEIPLYKTTFNNKELEQEILNVLNELREE